MSMDANVTRRRLVNPVPAEGDGGYSKTWWPVCLSREVVSGKVQGFEFLGGRVVIIRRATGEPQVLSAYCPHMGADLSGGTIVDNNLRCAFHHWQFDCEGRAVKTGIGDPAPRASTLFKFPTTERFGVIWAFNASEASWPLPELFPQPDAHYRWVAEYDKNGDFPCDAWVGMANTPDWNHLVAVHRLKIDTPDINNTMTFTGNSFHYYLEGSLEGGMGPRIRYDRWVWGTNIFVMYGTLDGSWFGVCNPQLQLGPNRSRNFYVCLVEKTDDAAADHQRCQHVLKVGQDMVNEDWPIIGRIHFKPGTLTKSDAGLSRFLDYVRKYPRTSEGLDFIN